MAMIEDTPETMIRTDLWNEMTLEQLARQQDLMVDKISAVQRMAGAAASPTILTMYSALQLGMSDLNKLIEYRSSKGKF
jgi:hypothetical protein